MIFISNVAWIPFITLHFMQTFQVKEDGVDLFKHFNFFNLNPLKILSILFDIYQECNLDTQHYLPFKCTNFHVKEKGEHFFKNFYFFNVNSLIMLSILFDIYQEHSLDTQHHLPLKVYAKSPSKRSWR